MRCRASSFDKGVGHHHLGSACMDNAVEGGGNGGGGGGGEATMLAGVSGGVLSSPGEKNLVIGY